MLRRCLIILSLVSGITAANLRADDSAPSVEELRRAIGRSLTLIEKASAGSAEQRKCFTCHNQALPVMVLVEAKKRGFAIDEQNLQRQIQHTIDHLERGRENYRQGRGQGGKVLTAGYALWTLEAGGVAANEITADVTGFVLKYQKEADRWSHPGNRPPSSGSDFTATYVALRSLAYYGTETQQADIAARKKVVGKWLLNETPRETEERVFRLRSLRYLDADEATARRAKEELLASQREDGGWAQSAEMERDAYATGSVLVALLRETDLTREHPAIRRGVNYLLDTQLEDGSWHVVTRAKPFQTYFESGYPHGKDQFISITAGSWATLALLLTLED